MNGFVKRLTSKYFEVHYSGSKERRQTEIDLLVMKTFMEILVTGVENKKIK